MTRIKKVKNIYCDESSVDNPDRDYMVIGGFFVSRNLIPEIRLKIKELRKKYYLNGELKWIKTSTKTLDFYKELFEFLFSYDSSDVSYRAIVVDKTEVDYKKYHQADKDLAFYKFYYQLLKNRLEKQHEYYIFLDFKPTKNKHSVKRLGEFIRIFNSNHGDDEPILKHIQAYPSDENVFIQIADIVTGAIAFSRNTKPSEAGSKSKKKLVEIIYKAINKENLNFCSSPWEQKFNIFCIKLGR